MVYKWIYYRKNNILIINFWSNGTILFNYLEEALSLKTRRQKIDKP
jgi:hypothetical protein